jgi:hypothetical protein
MIMKKESRNKFLIITIFALAMGYLEAVVVIYLRKIFYNSGFDFPLKGFIEPTILGIEWVREFATIVMLVTIAMLAGKKLYEKFAYFLYAFAIWDIFYYVSLKIFLDWPSSLFTWDILFLIPWPWIGPVLAPLIYSALFIIISVIIINNLDLKSNTEIKPLEWTLIIAGIFLVLFTWMYDYGKIIFSGYARDFFTLNNNPEFMNILTNYVPKYYNWPIFILGAILSFAGVLIFYLRTNRKLSGQFPNI